VPEDQVCVRLLLVSGLKTDLLLAPKDSVEDLKNRIFNNWPSDWTGERPETPANLRVLLRGKFLEPILTMGDAKIPIGQTTTCHLLIKN
ncbi:ubiquitin-2 like Rad60 SUMO-like-domain-containing protein, partial [Chytriomyces sp. MP71]